MSVMDPQDRNKKQILLRLSPELWRAIAQWAEDDFRSVNGQIEYLLHDSVQRHNRERKRKPGGDPGSPPDGTLSI